MPLPGHLYENGQESLWVVDTPTDLGGGFLGRVALVLNPLTIYAYGTTGWQPLASLQGATLPVVGNHNLASTTHPDVVAARSDGQILVWRTSDSLYHHETPMDLIAAASETAAGKVEHATEAEVQAGTAGNLVATVARLKAELDRRLTPPAWIAPTLLNSWVDHGAPNQVAGYRKFLGTVECRGLIKNGTTTNGTVLFNLPLGYRPAADRQFVGLQGANAACRLVVQTTGDVSIQGVTSNLFLSLESIRFDV